MENMIHVGAKIDKDTAENLASIIDAIFSSGRENVMDQSTIVEAVKMLGQVTEVKQVTITNSSFTNEKG